MQTAGNALGGVLGMTMAGMNANANYHDQKKLMNLQLRNQKELNEYNQQLAMKYWEDTNYEAQREQMEKAGLNCHRDFHFLEKKTGISIKEYVHSVLDDYQKKV